jgi:hypothetical protein
MPSSTTELEVVEDWPPVCLEAVTSGTWYKTSSDMKTFAHSSDIFEELKITTADFYTTFFHFLKAVNLSEP